MREDNGLTPFHLAVIRAHLQVVEAIFELAERSETQIEFGFSQKDKNGNNILHMAAKSETPITKLIIEKCKEKFTYLIIGKNNKDMSPIHEAASDEKYFENLDEFLRALKSFSDVPVKSSNENDVFLAKIGFDQIDISKGLSARNILKRMKKVDPEGLVTVDENGNTPLFYANDAHVRFF